MDWISHFFQSLEVSVQEPFTGAGLFFLAGILSSLFPCYYPLIPITIGFLQKRSEDSKHIWLHPFFYWLGTLFLYILLGILASTTGVILSQIMQNGWVILFFGFLFLYLCYAMLDFVNLEPSFLRKWEEKTKHRNGIFFTLLMGMVAGLAASACVTPAIVSILLFMTQISTQLSNTQEAIWKGMLFIASYGSGLGFPFFISGVLGAKLPKTGKWLNYIKYFFALVIGLVSFYQMHKGLIVLGISNDIAIYFLSLIFILLIISFFLIRFYAKKKHWNFIHVYRIFSYSSLIGILVFSIFTIFLFRENIYSSHFNSTGQKEIFKLNYGKYETKKNLKIYRSVQEAFDIAKQENKPVFIDFYADWCSNCVEFSKLMETDPELNSLLTKTIILKIYDTDPAFDLFASQKEFQELQIGLPFFVILDPDYKILFKTNFYKDIENMKKTIENFYKFNLK